MASAKEFYGPGTRPFVYLTLGSATAGVVIAAWATGNHVRGVPRRIGRDEPQPAVADPSVR